MKNLLKILFLACGTLLTATLFAQNVTINYQTWNPSSPPCNLFGTATNVPATINSSNSTIVHQTQIGQPQYSNTDQSVQMDCNYVNSSSILGTKYRLAYSFKVGYKYIITITAAEMINTAGT